MAPNDVPPSAPVNPGPPEPNKIRVSGITLRSVENEIESLLATDGATRADMSVAMRKLEKEITERTRIQEQMRESEEPYRTLVETTDTGYHILDRDGRVLDANREYIRLAGYNHLDEIRGRNVLEWTVPHELEKNGNAIQQCLSEGFIRGLEIDYLSPQGKVTTVEINATVVGTGNALRILALCRDVTDRKKTAERLQNMQKLESIGVLAGGIAHDFNNLLGGIFGYIQLAKNGAIPGSDTANNLSKVMTVFNRAKALTQQLLTFAKGGTPVKKITALPDLIRRTASFALSGYNITVEYRLAPDLLTVEADEYQLSSAMENILINASQAMPLGGTIFLSACNVPAEKVPSPRAAEGPYVMISFQDQGIGISKEVLPHVFDPFFTTKQQGNSGLGLTTAYSILRKHNGHIEAQSEPGRGTTITLYLPASGKPCSDLPV